MTLRPFRYHVAVVFLNEDDNETTSQPITVAAKNWDRFVADELPALVADTIANYQPPPALKPSAQPNRATRRQATRKAKPAAKKAPTG